MRSAFIGASRTPLRYAFKRRFSSSQIKHNPKLMNRRLLDFLIDPNDFATLQVRVFEGDTAKGDTAKGEASKNESEIREGVLVNAQTRRWYPIRDGIPSVFCDAFRVGAMKDEDDEFAARYANELEDVLHPGAEHHHDNGSEPSHDFKRIASERRARDEQAEAYDQMISMKTLHLFEVPAYTRAMNKFIPTPTALPLLEAGCGTGRFTDLFARYGSEVVAVDLSRDSILRNRVLHSGKTDSPVHYLHADLTHLPLRDNAFGSVANAGVYEHIPSREMRKQFVQHAHRVLVDGGAFLLSAYRYGGVTKLMEKEGEHAGGIPFHRFSPQELAEEVAPWFDVTYRQANVGIYMTMLMATSKK